ncbi:MAG: saccharopine dehydrogenase [Bacteroidetes bacterium HGW-Bacteroidetes-6]|nr:MAG: saccharopine dehydrogenase [Bacteroidetes bacterium HGW-Bacteroidetes-6]
MSKIIVLGAGMVGRAIALDLAKTHQVTSVDLQQASLDTINNQQISKVQADLSDTDQIKQLVEGFDLVVSAVPGFMGFRTLTAIIEAGKNFVDISFLPEDILQLSELATQRNVIGIADMGVAPGMPNFIAGYYYGRMKMNHFEYMVGGLPFERRFPFEYKAPFSPIDVVEEYTRPARMKENGVVLSKPAMSDPELLNFSPVGTLEAFNTDGLRSLLFTLPDVPNMKEKTLRYPGHIRLIHSLMAAGFFSETAIKVKNTEVVPFEFTTNLLFKSWKLQPEEREFTVMRVKLDGEKDGKKTEIVYDLFDEYDPSEKISSMARTTGFTATAGAELILQNYFTQKGVFPPELVGADENCFQFVLDYLAKRNVKYVVSEK